MEINAEKIKMMTNNTSGINTDIKVNGQKLETVTSFKYQGSPGTGATHSSCYVAGPVEDGIKMKLNEPGRLT